MKKISSAQNKKNRTYTKSNYKDANSNANKIYMIPLVFIIGIIPFIVRYHRYNTGLSVFSWFSTEDSTFDFFLYFKQLYFLITCSIMLLLIIYRVYRNKKDVFYKPIFIPLGIYAVLAFVSTILSQYPSFGFSGVFEQFESVFALLGYCLTAYYAFLYIETEADVAYIMRFFLYCVIILGILGTFQAIGHDFFSSEIGLRTILPRNLWSQAGEFEFKFGKYATYLSMYNPNYVGVYTALTIPVFACLALTAKELKTRILNLVAVIVLIISLYGSKSTAGIIGILAAALFILVFMRKYIFKRSKIILSILVLGVGLILVVICVKWNSITDRVHNLINPVKTETALAEINTTQDDIEIVYNGNELHISYTEDENHNINYGIKDGNDKEIPLVYNPATDLLDIQDGNFSNIHIKSEFYNNILITDVQIDGKSWRFTRDTENGKYYYINQFGRTDDILTAESAVFTGYESFASGRGYLWSRSIPLLEDHILLGSGADTFIFEFPQNDYVNLYNNGFGNETVTKPHSLYLQVGVQTGVLSLIAFLVFYAMYFISSVRLYIKGQFEDGFSQTGVAIFIGTVAFMITGISNDSCIAVTPVFWGLLGIGIAINYKIASMRK